MHICLSTDIDVKALKEIKSNGYDLSVYMTEHTLCCIKLYQDGQLEVTPGFSGVTSESSEGDSVGVSTSSERASLSVFLDQKTVKSGLSVGFKLTTNKIRSKTGVEYEYCIQNINDILIPHQLEEIIKRQKLSDMRASLQNRSSKEHSSWKQDPPSKGYDKVMGIYAEIVSGKDFSGSKLF